MNVPALWYSIPGASPAALLAPLRVRQLAAMRDAGIHNYEINYPISEGWKFPGRYQFGGVDAWLGHVVDIDPQSRILIRVDLHAPAFWYQLYPEEAVDYALGPPNQPRGRDAGDLASGIRPLRVSLASKRWRTATSQALTELVKHLKTNPYRRHVVGIMTACCTYGEWHYWGFFHLPDTGPAMNGHFRSFIRKKYRGNLNAVRKAWHKKLAGWDAVRVPGKERLTGTGSTFRSGANAAWTLDYIRCHHRLVSDTLIGFCRTVKQASGGKLLTGAFHGYFFNTPWRDEGGHLEFARVAGSPWVDYLAAPQIYDVHARDIGGTGLDRSLVATILKRGKLWFSEADTPTHIGRTMKQYWKTRSEIAVNLTDSVALVRRDAARAFTGNHQLWWFDFGKNHQGGEYLHPGIMADIKKMVRLSKQLKQLPTIPTAQVAVAYDKESPYHLAHWRSGKDSVSSGAYDQLVREAQYIGAPADALLWEDLEPRHRLVVVANAFHVDDERRQQIRKKVCVPDRVVVWMYAPGALGSAAPAQGITSLTGIKVRQLAGPVKPAIRFAKDSSLLSGLKGTAFQYRAAPVWMEKDADLLAPSRLYPAFRVTDPQAEPLGYWAGTRQVALAVKREKWGLSVFCGLPLLPRRFLRNLLAAAGGHIYCPSDDVWMANRSVLAVHTRRGGSREIRLSQPADVVDGFTGRTLARRARGFKVKLPRRSTSIWLLITRRSGG